MRFFAKEKDLHYSAKVFIFYVKWKQSCLHLQLVRVRTRIPAGRKDGVFSQRVTFLGC